MAEWFYKAKATKVQRHDTMMLTERGFLCRSAYNDKEEWAPLVRDVAFGDLIHFYFIDKKPFPFGAYEVVRKEDFRPTKDEPTAEDFDDVVEGTALYRVARPAFIARFDPYQGYQPDARLGVFTGWLLRRVGAAAEAPASFLSKQAPLVAR